MSYRLLQFLCVLLPTLLIGGFEYIRHDFLLHSLSMETGNLYITILTFVLSLLFSIWMFRTIKAMNDKLANEQSKRAVYEERERLARELHDGIAQSIFFMNIKLKQGDTEAASRALSTIDNHVRQAIFNLRSEPEIDDSLNSRITKWLTEWSSMTGVEVEEAIRIPQGFFTTKEEVQIFAIIQEAFANIRKHANATNAVVTIEELKEGWRLKISDDGKGINTTKKSNKQYGLSMMEERSKQLGGVLQIRNNPNGGTEILVTKE